MSWLSSDLAGERIEGLERCLVRGSEGVAAFGEHDAGSASRFYALNVKLRSQADLAPIRTLWAD